MPFVPSSFLLLVVRPGAPSSVLARRLVTQQVDSSAVCQLVQPRLDFVHEEVASHLQACLLFDLQMLSLPYP